MNTAFKQCMCKMPRNMLTFIKYHINFRNYGTLHFRFATYFSVFKLWFTLKTSASAEAPESPTLLDSRLWKRVLVTKNQYSRREYAWEKPTTANGI